MSLSAGEITAIVVGSGNIVAWAKLFYEAKKNGKGNGNNKPCPLHAQVVKEVTEAKTDAGNLKDNLDKLHTENRDDHKGILDKLGALTTVVANASAAAASAASAAATMATRYKRR